MIIARPQRHPSSTVRVGRSLPLRLSVGGTVSGGRRAKQSSRPNARALAPARASNHRSSADAEVNGPLLMSHLVRLNARVQLQGTKIRARARSTRHPCSCRLQRFVRCVASTADEAGRVSRIRRGESGARRASHQTHCLVICADRRPTTSALSTRCHECGPCSPSRHAEACGASVAACPRGARPNDSLVMVAVRRATDRRDQFCHDPRDGATRTTRMCRSTGWSI
jgi:hypothetical protein